MKASSVLLVDRSAALVAVLEELVAAAGYTVVGCRGFEAAREYLLANTPDAIVTGVRLDAYNGLHLISLARQRTPAVVAIIYSGSEDAGLQAEAGHWGATFLDKDRLADDLLPLLESLLAHPGPPILPPVTSRPTSDVVIGTTLRPVRPLEFDVPQASVPVRRTRPVS